MHFLYLSNYDWVLNTLYIHEWLQVDGVWRVWVNGIEIWAN